EKELAAVLKKTRALVAYNQVPAKIYAHIREKGPLASAQDLIAARLGIGKKAMEKLAPLVGFGPVAVAPAAETVPRLDAAALASLAHEVVQRLDDATRRALVEEDAIETETDRGILIEKYLMSLVGNIRGPTAPLDDEDWALLYDAIVQESAVVVARTPAPAPEAPAALQLELFQSEEVSSTPAAPAAEQAAPKKLSKTVWISLAIATALGAFAYFYGLETVYQALLQLIPQGQAGAGLVGLAKLQASFFGFVSYTTYFLGNVIVPLTALAVLGRIFVSGSLSQTWLGRKVAQPISSFLKNNRVSKGLGGLLQKGAAKSRVIAVLLHLPKEVGQTLYGFAFEKGDRLFQIFLSLQTGVEPSLRGELSWSERAFVKADKGMGKIRLPKVVKGVALLLLLPALAAVGILGKRVMLKFYSTIGQTLIVGVLSSLFAVMGPTKGALLLVLLPGLFAVGMVVRSVAAKQRPSWQKTVLIAFLLAVTIGGVPLILSANLGSSLSVLSTILNYNLLDPLNTGWTVPYAHHGVLGAVIQLFSPFGIASSYMLAVIMTFVSGARKIRKAAKAANKPVPGWVRAFWRSFRQPVHVILGRDEKPKEVSLWRASLETAFSPSKYGLSSLHAVGLEIEIFKWLAGFLGPLNDVVLKIEDSSRVSVIGAGDQMLSTITRPLGFEVGDVVSYAPGTGGLNLQDIQQIQGLKWSADRQARELDTLTRGLQGLREGTADAATRDQWQKLVKQAEQLQSAQVERLAELQKQGVVKADTLNMLRASLERQRAPLRDATAALQRGGRLSETQAQTLGEVLEMQKGQVEALQKQANELIARGEAGAPSFAQRISRSFRGVVDLFRPSPKETKEKPAVTPPTGVAAEGQEPPTPFTAPPSVGEQPKERREPAATPSQERAVEPEPLQVSPPARRPAPKTPADFMPHNVVATQRQMVTEIALAGEASADTMVARADAAAEAELGLVERRDSMGDGRYEASRVNSDGTPRVHHGIDYAAEEGTPVMALAGGTAQFSYQPNGAGYRVSIYAADGTVLKYFHLTENLPLSEQEMAQLKKGEFVQKTVKFGEVVGAAGRTGNADNPNIASHLHFEFWRNGEPRNPFTDFLQPNGLNPFTGRVGQEGPAVAGQTPVVPRPEVSAEQKKAEAAAPERAIPKKYDPASLAADGRVTLAEALSGVSDVAPVRIREQEVKRQRSFFDLIRNRFTMDIFASYRLSPGKLFREYEDPTRAAETTETPVANPVNNLLRQVSPSVSAESLVGLRRWEDRQGRKETGRAPVRGAQAKPAASSAASLGMRVETAAAETARPAAAPRAVAPTTAQQVDRLVQGLGTPSSVSRPTLPGLGQSPSPVFGPAARPASVGPSLLDMGDLHQPAAFLPAAAASPAFYPAHWQLDAVVQGWLSGEAVHCFIGEDGRVRLSIFQDANGNGVQDSNEKPLTETDPLLLDHLVNAIGKMDGARIYLDGQTLVFADKLGREFTRLDLVKLAGQTERGKPTAEATKAMAILGFYAGLALQSTVNADGTVTLRILDENGKPVTTPQTVDLDTFLKTQVAISQLGGTSEFLNDRTIVYRDANGKEYSRVDLVVLAGNSSKGAEAAAILGWYAGLSLNSTVTPEGKVMMKIGGQTPVEVDLDTFLRTQTAISELAGSKEFLNDGTIVYRDRTGKGYSRVDLLRLAGTSSKGAEAAAILGWYAGLALNSTVTPEGKVMMSIGGQTPVEVDLDTFLRTQAKISELAGAQAFLDDKSIVFKSGGKSYSRVDLLIASGKATPEGLKAAAVLGWYGGLALQSTMKDGKVFLQITDADGNRLPIPESVDLDTFLRMQVAISELGGAKEFLDDRTIVFKDRNGQEFTRVDLVQMAGTPEGVQAAAILGWYAGLALNATITEDGKVRLNIGGAVPAEVDLDTYLMTQAKISELAGAKAFINGTAIVFVDAAGREYSRLDLLTEAGKLTPEGTRAAAVLGWYAGLALRCTVSGGRVTLHITDENGNALPTP
ncbi:MAG TPA: peptidoglycan DD-metalloendopeptidase family protein, partial [Elusimicrobiota bacterium]|nr:peptidoglycan DD-metalloendopeptidase family protein [Elusimicrobiota bacterium]